MRKTKKKILIVEDDPNFVSILKEEFSREGFTVLVAQDGKEGVRTSESEKPDLLVTDILLPMLNGIDMAKQIRGKGSEPPVIFLTNVKDSGYSNTIKKIKKADYLVKSDVKLAEIVSAAKKLLGKR